MKAILALLLTTLTLTAQQFAVKVYGPGNAQGLPDNWPQIVQPLADGAQVPAGYTAMTQAQVDALKSANQAAYDAAVAAKAASDKAALDANMARLLALYAQIPGARATLSGFANGTNTLTLAQLTTATRQMAGYMDATLELLQRLGPVLKSIYKPEQDGAN